MGERRKETIVFFVLLSNPHLTQDEVRRRELHENWQIKIKGNYSKMETFGGRRREIRSVEIGLPSGILLDWIELKRRTVKKRGKWGKRRPSRYEIERDVGGLCVARAHSFHAYRDDQLDACIY